MRPAILNTYLFTLLVLLYFLSACEPTARTVEQGEVVNLYSNAIWVDDQSLFSAYENTSGVRVNIISESGDQLLERMVRLKGDSTNADVILFKGTDYLRKADHKGLLDTLENSSYASLIPDLLKSQKQKWIGLGYSAFVISYLRDSVDTLQIQRYQSLADPQWQGKIGLNNEKGAYTPLLAAMLADWESQATQSWWDTMKQSQISTDTLAQIRLVDTSWPMPDQASWGILVPEPEVYVQITGVAINEVAPHPARAESLFNFIFSSNFMRNYAQRHQLYPSHLDVEAPGVLPTISPQQIDTTLQTNINRYVDEAKAIQQ